MSDYEQPIIICSLYAEGNYGVEGSVVREASCGHEVWLSPSGAKIEADMGARLMCHQCAQALASEDPDAVNVQPITEEQKRELAKEGMDAPSVEELQDALLTGQLTPRYTVPPSWYKPGD